MTTTSESRTPNVANALQSSDDVAPRYQLTLRFLLINMVGAGLAAAIWVEGWIDEAFSGYTLWLTTIILAAFVYGLFMCARRVLRVDAQLNALTHKAGSDPPRLQRLVSELRSSKDANVAVSVVIETSIDTRSPCGRRTSMFDRRSHPPSAWKPESRS